jgi:hypothetical protein
VLCACPEGVHGSAHVWRGAWDSAHALRGARGNAWVCKRSEGCVCGSPKLVCAGPYVEVRRRHAAICECMQVG